MKADEVVEIIAAKVDVPADRLRSTTGLIVGRSWCSHPNSSWPSSSTSPGSTTTAYTNPLATSLEPEQLRLSSTSESMKVYESICSRTAMGGDQAQGLRVLWLDDPRCAHSELTGNKCATLARLVDLGYDVPPGFCLTTTALSAGRDTYKGDLVESTRRLKSPWVARSSSTAEDGHGHAFPGLFTTVLDLPDVGSLMRAIEKIELGTHSEVVLAYARELGVDPQTVRMAILVQSLVPATAAGVAFSRDPVSEEENVVVESNYGLGETVVDGSVTPDSFTVNSDGELIDRTRGTKRHKVVATTLGARVRRVDTSDLERSDLSLGDEDALAVARVTRKLEADLGYPVDVEWAFSGDRLYVLQARPITTIGEPSPLTKEVAE